MPLLGLCPIGKCVFSHQDALRYKNLLRERLVQWGVQFVDMEDVIPDGIVREQRHVQQVVRHFDSARVDCRFVPDLVPVRLDRPCACRT